MNVRRLTPDDAAAFHALRLAGLRDTPTAFESSLAEERDMPPAHIAEWLAPADDRGIFGAFDGQRLVGLCALGREGTAKASHKGFVWGMVVLPAARRSGVGRALLAETLALARSVAALRQVNLCVNAGNAAAIRLYEAAGFKAFGREPGALLVDGVLHDEILMQLPLRPA